MSVHKHCKEVLKTLRTFDEDTLKFVKNIEGNLAAIEAENTRLRKMLDGFASGAVLNDVLLEMENQELKHRKLEEKILNLKEKIRLLVGD